MFFFHHRPILVSRNSQDVTGSALSEVWLRLVDLGLDDDRALPPVHAALDGTCDVHLQLPLLTLEVAKQGPDQLSDAALIGGHHALQAHHEIPAVLGVEHNQLVLPGGHAHSRHVVEGDALHGFVLLQGVHLVQVAVSDEHSPVLCLVETVDLAHVAGE